MPLKVPLGGCVTVLALGCIPVALSFRGDSIVQSSPLHYEQVTW